ncbi:MAG TPA: tetraacyldisaccharide 4'-kinase [Casimicrobiaceae bacterium]|nr:tetraacyldisaccharide 4'-kinase [Casimicrobiaceae bacterium]
MSLQARLVASWYRPHLAWTTLALTPFALVYGALVSARRALYRLGVFSSAKPELPVVVVGNITVGGTGKTPVVLALAESLLARGFRPGVVSRGYGRARRDAQVVTPETPARESGDEPLLIARRGWPVAVAARRIAAAELLQRVHPECDVIIADDGLQHYALRRDVEVAVIDGARSLGNRWLVPAGPLREPVRRLREVDAVIVNGADERSEFHWHARTFVVRLTPEAFVSVAEPSRSLPVTAFAGRKAHALAAIGHPQRFFAMLRTLGVDPLTHSFPDHYAFTPGDLPHGAELILMTEKDAVKCIEFADARCWFLRVACELDAGLVDAVAARMRDRGAPARR